MSTPRLPLPRLLPGLLLALLLGLAAVGLAAIPHVARLQLSALTLAIVLGMLLGNAVGARVPPASAAGIAFAQRSLLRAGVVLYGLRISFQQIAAIGPGALALDLAIVGSTLALGLWIGRRWLGLDRDTALLTACGSAICGAAAVLATERVVRAEPGKVAIAIASVVLFGTLDIFLYPQLFPHLGLAPLEFGVYAGATVHEVAQVVAVGSAIGPQAADTAVIVKLTRVLLLVPFLFVLGGWQARRGGERGAISVPWFALAFVGVCAFNSLVVLPAALRAVLLDLDTLLLATAMAALGLETRFARLRALGPKPLLLALLLFGWLAVGGYWLTRALV
ncbi:MAG TPA: putative sulfate exporter family transporter [Dokdonella sp.]|nr:putative sulfate exporter family transporter [Dokdonella sp.]